MNYLEFVKRIGWDKLTGVVVRVVAAIVEAIVRRVARRKSRQVAPAMEDPEQRPWDAAPADGVQVTVSSISTETITVTQVRSPP
jgi:hypothetical protein